VETSRALLSHPRDRDRRDLWNCPGSLIAARTRLKLHDERKFGSLLHSIYEAARPSGREQGSMHLPAPGLGRLGRREPGPRIPSMAVQIAAPTVAPSSNAS
jgi:hypothetical protein